MLVAREIAKTEQNYVMALQTLVYEYLKPIREGRVGKMEPADIRAMFGDIEVILGYAEQLLLDLEKVVW